MKIIPFLLCLLGAVYSNITFAKTANHGISQVPLCYDFGCKVKTYIDMPQSDWQTIVNIFATPSANGHIERIKIAKAISQMEIIMGKYTPIHNDIGYNVGIGDDKPGQLDCIDESLNTTTFLSLFEMAGFLKHNTVVERAYRKAIFDQHWSAQVQDNASGERYVVDTWFKKNGEPPLVQPINDWLDIPIYTSY